MHTMTPQGHLPIPPHYRHLLGLGPDTPLEFDIVGGDLRIRKAASPPMDGQHLIARMRGQGTVPVTTDDVMHMTRGE